MFQFTAFPNTFGNSFKGQSIAGGIKEGSFFKKQTGEQLIIKNLAGKCPVKLITEIKNTVSSAISFTCSYYDPELKG